MPSRQFIAFLQLANRKNLVSDQTCLSALSLQTAKRRKRGDVVRKGRKNDRAVMNLGRAVKFLMGVMAIETGRGVGPWKKPSALDVTSPTAAGQGETVQVKGIVSIGMAVMKGRDMTLENPSRIGKFLTGVKVIETGREVSLRKKPSAQDVMSLKAASQGETALMKGKVSNAKFGTMTGGRGTTLKTRNSQGIARTENQASLKSTVVAGKKIKGKNQRRGPNPMIGSQEGIALIKTAANDNPLLRDTMTRAKAGIMIEGRDTSLQRTALQGRTPNIQKISKTETALKIATAIGKKGKGTDQKRGPNQKSQSQEEKAPMKVSVIAGEVPQMTDLKRKMVTRLNVTKNPLKKKRATGMVPMIILSADLRSPETGPVKEIGGVEIQGSDMNAQITTEAGTTQRPLMTVGGSKNAMTAHLGETADAETVKTKKIGMAADVTGLLITKKSLLRIKGTHEKGHQIRDGEINPLTTADAGVTLETVKTKKIGMAENVRGLLITKKGLLRIKGTHENGHQIREGETNHPIMAKLRGKAKHLQEGLGQSGKILGRGYLNRDAGATILLKVMVTNPGERNNLRAGLVKLTSFPSAFCRKSLICLKAKSVILIFFPFAHSSNSLP